MRTLIIEDEEGPRISLRNHLKQYCPHLQLIGEATSIGEAQKLITALRPDLLLMDVYLEDGNSLELLDQPGIKASAPRIIFITAHDDFAMEAFRHNAVHYLLKPFVAHELMEAINRASAQLPDRAQMDSVRQAFASARSQGKIAVHTLSKVHYIRVERVVRCESEDSYTYLYLDDGTHLLSSKPMKEYEDLLIQHGFYRIHRSHLINLDKVIEYRKSLTDSIVMEDGSQIKISRKKRADFMHVMQQHSNRA